MQHRLHRRARARAGAAGWSRPLRERPTASATCSCVSLNSSMRRFRPAGFLDRVQVLALDVLDQADAERGLVGHVAHERRHLLEAGHARRAPAPLAGEDLVLRRRPTGRTTIGWITPRARIESASSASDASSMRVRGWYLPGRSDADRQAARSSSSPARVARSRPAARRGRGPVPCAWSSHAASVTLMPLRASSSRANCRCASAPFEAGSCSSTGLPKDGASAMRMLRGITVSKTLSP